VNPANPGAWNLRGALLERSDSPAAAARCYAEAARLLDSHTATLQHTTAASNNSSGDSGSSVAAARRAVVSNWVRALTAAADGETALTVLADAASKSTFGSTSDSTGSVTAALEQGRALMAAQRWSEAAALLSAAAAAAVGTGSSSSEAGTTAAAAAAAATAAACAHYFAGDHAAAVTAATELVQAVPLLAAAVAQSDRKQYWSSLMVGLCLGGLCGNIGLAQVSTPYHYHPVNDRLL
jgi:hypothetical protein